MRLPAKQKGITPITIDEFSQSGMFALVNTFLHPFGMALVGVREEGKPERLFPARVTFRGFNEADQDEMHERIAQYLADNAKDFPKDIK